LTLSTTCEYQQRGNKPQPKTAILILLTKTWLLERERKKQHSLEIPFHSILIFDLGLRKKGLGFNFGFKSLTPSSKRKPQLIGVE
jgi:hypothetical protein